MPCDYKKYPANWKTEIRPRILARAGNKCERCGGKNNTVYIRGKTKEGQAFFQEDDGGKYWNADTGELMGEDYACFNPGEVKLVRIVLTIAHIHDNDPMACADDNLQALCQRCHLRHDIRHHNDNARNTRDKKKGIQRLF